MRFKVDDRVMSKKISHVCFHSPSAKLTIKKQYWQIHATYPKRIDHFRALEIKLWKGVGRYISSSYELNEFPSYGLHLLRDEVLINCKTENYNYIRFKMRCALGLPSGGFKKKRCLRSRTIFKMLAKNSSQTSQVRSRSALGSRCSLNMTTKRYKSKQSTNDYATSNFTTTVTVLEIHNNMWNSFFGCFCVPNSLSNEETPLNFPWLRVLWRKKRKLYRKSTDQHCVRTDWLASLPMAFALVSKRVTVHNISFDGCAWLSWRKILFRSTQNWMRQCGIRKHTSV